MSDLDVLRELQSQIDPPRYDELEAVAKKRARRSALGAGLAVAAAVVCVGLGGAHWAGTTQAEMPADEPTPSPSISLSEAALAHQWPGLPAAGTPVSAPAEGRLVMNIQPPSGWEWNVYADGRIVWQRWSDAGDPLVIPIGADPSRTTYVQQRLTPQGVQLLLSKILATGRAASLFEQSMSLKSANAESTRVGWYRVCTDGRLVDAQVLSPDDVPGYLRLETPDQVRALTQISTLMRDSASTLPASAWTDRTIRPYVPSRYDLGWDRFDPDPSKLPSPAKEVLQPLLRPGVHGTGSMTTTQTRTLLAAFAQTGVKVVSNHAGELGFELPAATDGDTTVLRVTPAIPSSPLEESNQC